MQYTEFKLIAESSNGNLSEDVSSYLKDGWELYGFPIVQEGIFFQAIVKCECENIKEKEHGKHIRK